MKSYWWKTVAAAALFYAAALWVACFVRAPIQAEYWVRETILIKRRLVAQIPGPKIVLLGGSGTLFGVDAVQAERALGVPVFNFGLHAGLRLPRLLEEGRRAVRPGDVLVLFLESHYYERRPAWNGWQVSNALAWDRASFDSLPLLERLGILVVAAPSDLWWELLAAAADRKILPRRHQAALSALAPEPVVFRRYLDGTCRDEANPYWAYNLDTRGDVPRMEGTTFFPAGGRPPEAPGEIDPQTRVMLARFVSEMGAARVRVLFAHPPYDIEGEPGEGWREAEVRFRKSIGEIGSVLIDQREELFFPRRLFYNHNLHLNAEGRDIRTRLLIESLRQGSFLPAPTSYLNPSSSRK